MCTFINRSADQCQNPQSCSRQPVVCVCIHSEDSLIYSLVGFNEKQLKCFDCFHVIFQWVNWVLHSKKWVRDRNKQQKKQTMVVSVWIQLSFHPPSPTVECIYFCEASMFSPLVLHQPSSSPSLPPPHYQETFLYWAWSRSAAHSATPQNCPASPLLRSPSHQEPAWWYWLVPGSGMRNFILYNILWWR